MQKNKMTFKRRLDAELRKISPEDIKKSSTAKTSKLAIGLPWRRAYDDVTGDWYLDKFTALMCLKYEYNKLKKTKPDGNDAEWFNSACKEFFYLYEDSYSKNKKNNTISFNRGIFKDSDKDAAVACAEMIIFINNFLDEIRDECGEIDCYPKYQSFCEKEAPELPQLKISYKNYRRKFSGKTLSELDGLSSGAEKMAEFAGGAIGIAVVVAVVIGLISIVMNLGSSSSSSRSSSGSNYPIQTSSCEPIFRSCVNNSPERLWYNCQSNYSICLSNSR